MCSNSSSSVGATLLTWGRPQGRRSGHCPLSPNLICPVYDPFLLQLFINKLGKYPPGTLLEVEIVLKGRTMVFVLCSSSLVRSRESFDKPICKLIRLHDGRPAPEKLRNRSVDLMKKGKVLGVLNDW